MGDHVSITIYSAIPLQFVKGVDMAIQNRVARSWLGCMYSWSLLYLLEPDERNSSIRSSLQWIVPAFAALLPGLLDTMTAVNDDVGAVFVFSIFLLY